METVFSAIPDKPGEYEFEFEGTMYRFISKGPHLLQFTLHIERASENQFAHVGAETFFTGVMLPTGRFARARAFAAYRYEV